jgi:hypothetical protein
MLVKVLDIVLKFFLGDVYTDAHVIAFCFCIFMIIYLMRGGRK